MRRTQRTITRVISLLLITILIVSIFAATYFAEDTEQVVNEVTIEKSYSAEDTEQVVNEIIVEESYLDEDTEEGFNEIIVDDSASVEDLEEWGNGIAIEDFYIPDEAAEVNNEIVSRDSYAAEEAAEEYGKDHADESGIITEEICAGDAEYSPEIIIGTEADEKAAEKGGENSQAAIADDTAEDVDGGRLSGMDEAAIKQFFSSMSSDEREVFLNELSDNEWKYILSQFGYDEENNSDDENENIIREVNKMLASGSDEDEMTEELQSMIERRAAADEYTAFIEKHGCMSASEAFNSLDELEKMIIYAAFGAYVSLSMPAQECEDIAAEVRAMFGAEDNIMLMFDNGGAANISYNDPKVNSLYNVNTQLGDYQIYNAYTGEYEWMNSSAYAVNGISAFCAEASSWSPAGKSGNAHSTVNDIKTMVYLLSPCGPLYGKYDFSTRAGAGLYAAIGGDSNIVYNEILGKNVYPSKDRVICHCIISGIYCNDWGPFYDNNIAALKAIMSDISALFANDVELKKWYQGSSSYVVEIGNNTEGLDVQDVYWVEAAALQEGTISMKKESSPATAKNTYTMEGALYALYTDTSGTLYSSEGLYYGFKIDRNNTAYKAVCPTGKNPKAAANWKAEQALSIKLPCGTYYIKEITAPSNGLYTIDNSWHTAVVEPEKNTTVTSTDYGPGFVEVLKTSQSTAFCSNNSLYSLEGAEYRIYSSMSLSEDSLAAVLKTDKSGKTAAAVLKEGTYYIIETKASPGHDLDANSKRGKGTPIVVAAGKTTEYKSTDPVLNDPLSFVITKKGIGDNSKMPLEGVLFEIKYYDNINGNISGTPVCSWKIKTVINGKGEYQAQLGDTWLAEGSSPLYKINGLTVLPLGTYAVREISTAAGYTLKDGYIQLKGDDSTKVDSETGTLVIVVENINGNVTIKAGNEYVAGNAPTILASNAKGITENCTGGSSYFDAGSNMEGLLVDTVTMDNLEAGSQYRLRGMLYYTDTGEPYDNTEIEDIFTAEKGSGVVRQLEFSLTDSNALSGKSLTACEILEQYRDGQWKKAAEEMDHTLEAQTVYFVEIHTELIDENTKDKTAKPGPTTFTDTVYYKGLITGKSYTLKGKVIDKTTGEEAGSGELLFTAENTEGRCKLEISINAEAGHTYVAYEELYEGDTFAAEHKDPDDEAQTVYAPEISTSLKDMGGSDTALAASSMSFIDTVYCRNLVPGREYTIQGKLYNKSTGKPALDDKGQEITSSLTFICDSSDSCYDIKFDFSGISLAGESLVAFETLFYNGIEITGHSDINDVEQTVDLPRINTELYNSADSEKEICAGENMVLTDKVIYMNLDKDEEYCVTGTLYDKESGQPAKDDEGQIITAAKTFTAGENDGSIEIIYSFDGETLAGHTLVSYVEVDQGNIAVAGHNDIDSLAQTVTVPCIATSLTDSSDGNKEVYADNRIALIDHIRYSNLTEGCEYIVRGILMDRESGIAAVDDKGKVIEAEKKFTAKDSEGEIELEFEFSGSSLAGHTLVAFESLYKGENVIALHRDINDREQSVFLPEIKTTLKDKEHGNNVVYASEKIILCDRVQYDNLTVGPEYTIKGVLMDKASGKNAVDDSGREIASEITFTAEKNSGSIEVIFEFSGKSLAGKSLVAFEKLYRGEKQLAVHSDIEDENQTVDIPGFRTVAELSGGKKWAGNNKSEIVTDTITYTNLKAGRYIVVGTLTDKTSGKAAVINGCELRTEKTVEISESCGTVEIEFKIPAGALKGSYVVFEEIYIETDGSKILIGEHKDINDADQTVDFYTPDTVPKTGDESNIGGWMIIAAAAFLTAAAGIIILTRKNEIN